MGQRVVDAAQAAKKFTTRGAAAANDYRDGVAAAGGEWHANTVASEENYNQGVQAAISRGAFGAGVRKAGPTAYTERALSVGVQRFPSGIQGAGQAWAQGAAPYLQVAASTQLTPRGPKGSPQNMTRASEMATAMRRKKTGE